MLFGHMKYPKVLSSLSPSCVITAEEKMIACLYKLVDMLRIHFYILKDEE